MVINRIVICSGLFKAHCHHECSDFLTSLTQFEPQLLFMLRKSGFVSDQSVWASASLISNVFFFPEVGEDPNT